MPKKKPKKETAALLTGNEQTGKNADTPATLSPPYPVVGIGASAGGLEAIESFFKGMPEGLGTGMAFVVVQHLDPTHKSMLMELVKQYTRMPVYQVTDGIIVKPDSVYIIPPNNDLAYLQGRLHLMEPGMPRGMRLPIDFFFRSLALDLHEKAICVILSGTGTDGTLGLQAVKGEGGLAIVQEPASAAYDGMPRSAISTGLVDFVLPPAGMAAQLLNYSKRAFSTIHIPAVSAILLKEETLNKVLITLRDRTGHDFSRYKRNTIQRRIARRLAVNQIEQFDEYIRILKQNKAEVELLFRDLLIGVTNFFRDPESFECLKQCALPKLAEKISPEAALRVWVPACSTGEEAYSLAILFQEYFAMTNTETQVQIFATDIDAESIEKARTGIFPESIAADINPDRLARFFTAEKNTYRVGKQVRDMVVFAKQDVIKDPPFSKLDLISCRNLLIYFETELQQRVLSLFHYALNPGGFLFLGSSESVGGLTDCFSTVSKKWKLYASTGRAARQATLMKFSRPVFDVPSSERGAMPSSRDTKSNLKEILEQILLGDYAPPSVIINPEFEIQYIFGHTGKYLEPAAGVANLYLPQMLREGLKLEVLSAVRKVLAGSAAERLEGLRVKSDGGSFLVNLVVRPLSAGNRDTGLILLVFESAPDVLRPEIAHSDIPESEKDSCIAELRTELRAKEEFLQTTVEELETSNEELKSTNEELQSANEELQSTNEELETSKEELQSVNEELTTVNTELQKKIEELSRVNNDMNNLLAGTGIGTIFVDHKMIIRRFTPAATQIINLIQADVGRPVNHIVSRLVNHDTLLAEIKKVLDTLVPLETEVQTVEKRFYLMRIQPYRTLENVIEGAVLTFVEVGSSRE